MDNMNMPSGAASTGLFHTLSSSAFGSNLLQVAGIAAIVMIALRLEIERRSGKMKLPLTATPQGFLASGKKVLEQYAPELMGLVVCLAMAVALRMNDGGDSLSKTTEASFTVEHPEVGEAIRRTWPILATADSLLGLQSMLRLLVLVSSVLRTDTCALLLSREVAALSCVAILGRVVLSSHWKIYMLDGPLGGYLPMACDLVSAPLLAFLTCGINQQKVAASAAALIVAACVGSTNYLVLAPDHLANGLFVFVHMAEFFAAFAYLSRALLSDVDAGSNGRKSVALWFAHIVMPIQACLSAYYFVVAFKYAPGVVGAGFPFEILKVANCAQVAAFAGASLLHFTAQFREAKEAIPLAKQEPCKEAPAAVPVLGYGGEIMLTPRGGKNTALLA